MAPVYPTSPDAESTGEALGNNREHVDPIPEYLSHGNLAEGETVVYLGCGRGIDVFLAASKLGPNGSVIGLDSSEDMISLARKSAAVKRLTPPQVTFVQALLNENLPLESNSVDCILSKCVAHFTAPDGRASLLKEVTRILKPGGRVVLVDIVAKKPIPNNVNNNIATHLPRFSDAIIVEEYQSILEEAGLSDAQIFETKDDLNIYDQSRQVGKLTCDINEWVGAYQISAVKLGPPVDKPSTVLYRWWDAYPTAKSSPSFMTAEEVVALKKEPASSAEFTVIDVRRGDHGGGHVRGSDNWAAQTFYDDLPAFYEKYKNTPKVIFYCSKSNGRGPRCAGWYQDYLDSQAEDHKSTAYVLKGGVKNWLAQYGDHDDLVDRD